ncbi:methyl-accepting chemotaxis protein [Phosphitispora sp. TUW77]
MGLNIKRLGIKGKLMVMMFVVALFAVSMLSIVSVYSMNSRAKETLIEKAKSDLATGEELINRTFPGDWAVQDGKLYKGNVVMNENYELIDKIAELTNDTVTIFQGDTRVATTVKRDGVRQVNTKVSDEVKQQVLVKGLPFYGEADVVGVKYQTAYKPIKDADGNIIGIWYVGVSKQFLDALSSSFITTIFIFGIGILILNIISGLFFAKTIADPINKVKEAVERAAQGDLTSELLIRSKDEIGVLASSFNRMTGNMKQIISEIIVASEHVAAAANEFSINSLNMTRSNQEVNNAIEEVAKGNAKQTQDITGVVKIMDKHGETINSIAKGAAQQAEKVNSTSMAVGQMVTGVEKVASSAKFAADTAEETSQVAGQGGQAVEKVVSGMENIKSKVFDAANRIKELGERSQQIGEIIQVIDDIAEQTNLLALNAAIEAARAGEHGKGFAVVADEVRKLAERSGKATKEIAELVNAIQGGTERAVSAMNEGTQEVENGAGLAADAGSALERIINNVAKTNDEIHNISKVAQQISEYSTEVAGAMEVVSGITEENSIATQEMAGSSDEVIRAIEEIAAIAQESAAAAQQVTASCEQMYSTSELISSSSKELAVMAQNLKELSLRFSV